MLAELRPKAQIIIPKEIIVKLGLSEGDKLDIFECSVNMDIRIIRYYEGDIRIMDFLKFLLLFQHL